MAFNLVSGSFEHVSCHLVSAAMVSDHGGTGCGLWLSAGLSILWVGESISHSLTLDLVKRSISRSQSMTRDLLN